LVRFNPGGSEPIEKAPVTISRVNSDRTVTHVRIRPYHNRGYQLRYELKGCDPVVIKFEVRPLHKVMT